MDARSIFLDEKDEPETLDEPGGHARGRFACGHPTRMMTYRDRAEAGRKLAAALAHMKGRNDLLVLALPRGGVPVAAEVARTLGAPWIFASPTKSGPQATRSLPSVPLRKRALPISMSRLSIPSGSHILIFVRRRHSSRRTSRGGRGFIEVRAPRR